MPTQYTIRLVHRALTAEIQYLIVPLLRCVNELYTHR